MGDKTRESRGKILGKEVIPYRDLIFYYTRGHPYYLVKFCEHLRDHHEKINELNIKHSYLYVLLNKDGALYSLFAYIYDTSLERVAGHILVKSVLSVLSLEDGLTLTKISEKVNRRPGQVKKALEELKNVDIIFEEGGGYYFLDPIFRFWLAKKEHGVRVSLALSQREVWEIVRNLEEKYLQTSTELGHAKEAEIRERLKEKFGFEFRRYQKRDIEIDAVGYDKEMEEYLLIEVKHRNKLADYRVVEKFLKKR